MTTSDADVEAFLTEYAAALTAFDARRSADLWATPGMIVDDAFAGVLDQRDDMVAGLERSYPVYQRLGLASVGHELLETRTLSERITMLTVRWLFHDAGGELLTDSTAHYVVRLEDAGLRACVCIQVDDAEKLQALAAERGVDLSAADA